MADKKNWLQVLAYVTGSINQERLLRNEYLTAENHILKSQIKGRLRLSDGERATLAGIAKRLGRKALQEIACIAQPDTILAWYRELVAEKFDGSKKRGLAGRPRVDAAIEALVVKLARENSGWGYDRIVGAGQFGSRDFRPERGQYPAALWDGARPEAQTKHTLERVHSVAPGCAGRHGLLYGGSAHVAGSSDVLCAVLHTSGQPASIDRRNHESSRHYCDGADGSKRDAGGTRMLAPLPISSACMIGTPSSANRSARC